MEVNSRKRKRETEGDRYEDEPKEDVDWTLRIPNIILEVIDQGLVVSCAMITATEVCAIILALRNCSLPVRLAAQQLINDLPLRLRHLCFHPPDEYGVFPVFLWVAFHYISLFGVGPESSMPYVGPRGSSQMPASAPKVSIKGTIWVNNPCIPRQIFNRFGMENVKETYIDIRAVLNFHSVGGDLEVYPSFTHACKNGSIYYGPEGEEEAFFLGYHAVVVTGMGKYKGEEFLKIKNSGGIKWGTLGSGRVSKRLLRSFVFPEYRSVCCKEPSSKRRK